MKNVEILTAITPHQILKNTKQAQMITATVDWIKLNSYYKTLERIMELVLYQTLDIINTETHNQHNMYKMMLTTGLIGNKFMEHNIRQVMCFPNVQIQL